MLPSLAGLPLRTPHPLVPTGMEVDEPSDARVNPHDVLGGEPGLMELILAMGALDRDKDDTAIEETCHAVSNFLAVDHQSNALDRPALWRTLMANVFPDAPRPPRVGPVSDREWFITMCMRYTRYLAAKRKHARLAEEAYDAQQDLHEALEDWNRIRNFHDSGSRISKDAYAHWTRARRRAHELSASEQTALHEMNDAKHLLTHWFPG